MNSQKIFLCKSKSPGLYILRIVRVENGKRIINKIQCSTKYKRDAINFLNHYLKKCITNSQFKNKKISVVKNLVLNYVKSNLSKGSYEKYELMFKSLITNLGDRDVDSLTLNDIELFKTKLSCRIRKETVNSYLRNIKAAWNLMVKLNLIPKNNLKEIQQFKIPEKEIVSFAQSEINLILDSIEHQRIKIIIEFALNTGLRISELLNLRMNNLDFINDLILVNNSDDFQTKSRKNRVIPFNTKIEQILTELIYNQDGKLKDKNNYLFSRIYNVPFKRNHVTRYFRKLLDKLNFDKKYHFHCLRATFIMNLVRKGVSPIIIQKLVGNSTLSVTQRYCFIQVDDLRNAINA